MRLGVACCVGALSWMLAFAACSTSTKSTVEACGMGEIEGCQHESGCTGTKRCLEDGTFGPCSCADAGASGGTGGSGGMAGSGAASGSGGSLATGGSGGSAGTGGVAGGGGSGGMAGGSASGGTGAVAGSSGTAGQAATGGAGGVAGNSGAGGAAGGTGGSSGQAGASGTGGSAGVSGAAGSGAAGSSGVDAGTDAGVFAPDRVSGCVLWLRADLGTTVSGSGVSVWKDQCAGNDVASPSGAEPTLTPAAINGHPTLTFDGATKYLENTSTNLVLAGAPRSVVLVGTVANDGGAYLTFRRTTPISSFSHAKVNTTFIAHTDGVAVNHRVLPVAEFDALSTPFASVAVTSSSGDWLTVRINGTLKTVDPLTPPNSEAGGMLGFTIGGRLDIPAYFDGSIAEIIVYDRTLDAAEIQSIETYVLSRYAL